MIIYCISFVYEQWGNVFQRGVGGLDRLIVPRCRRSVNVVISDELCSRNHGVNEWVLNEESWDKVSPLKGSITISRSFTLRGIPVVI